MIRYLLCAILLISSSAFGQNLLEERIWKISPRKKSIFLDSGVFHLNSTQFDSKISGVRNSVVGGRDYERVVIDFTTTNVPKLYGQISSKDKRISVDFFDTAIATAQPTLKNSKFVKSIDFISVDGKTLTMNMNLKGKASFDIFYLESPGRLVIDIR